MGSKPTTDHSARVFHAFQGSWRGSLDLRLEYGKLCRTFLGRCRHWSKTPSYKVPRGAEGNLELSEFDLNWSDADLF